MTAQERKIQNCCIRFLTEWFINQISLFVHEADIQKRHARIYSYLHSKYSGRHFYSLSYKENDPEKTSKEISYILKMQEIQEPWLIPQFEIIVDTRVDNLISFRETETMELCPIFMTHQIS